MAHPYTADQIFPLEFKKQNASFNPNDNIILLTFDDNYVDQSINLILSIAKYHPSGVSFICISPMLTREHQEAVLGLPQGIQLNCCGYSPVSASGRWPACALYRLFTAWLLDDNVHKVVYMDSDMLCTGSLQELFDLDVPCLAMCNEISGNVSQTQEMTVRRYLPARIYCNSGVSVFNLDYFRKEHTFHEIYTELNKMRDDIVYPDQDFLNIYFQDRITYLNAFYYNFQAYELKNTHFYNAALKVCRLIHFSVGKPWLYKSRLYLMQLYLKHSLYPPMIQKVKKTMAKRILYLPIATARHMLSPFKQAYLARRKSN